MRLISNNPVADKSPSLLSRLGRGLRPLWQRGRRRQHLYRLHIRCEDRADMEQVLAAVSHTLQPAGLHPVQSMTPGRSGGRELVLNLKCTPPQRRYLVQFVHQVGAAHPVRWELRPRGGDPERT
mgnify:CR=1 FL=1